MTSRYVIWDKTSDVITPIGEVLTPEEWIGRYPVARALPTVVAGGVINGAFFGVYSQMVEMYEKMGCDFSKCTTEQEHLDAIEAFEDARNAALENGTTVETEERITDLEETVAMQEEQLVASDEAVVALYEMQSAQDEINVAQDEAITGLYEMLGKEVNDAGY